MLVIYQSGYLTIKEYNEEFMLYTLGFPNEEVKYGFLNFVAPFYIPISVVDAPFYIGKLINELRSGETDVFMTRLKAFYADFLYELNEKTECHYQVVFYLVFKLMGQFTDADPLTKMHKFGCVARKIGDKFMHAAEVLKIGILTPLLYYRLIRDVSQMFENQQAAHQTDWFSRTTIV